MRPHDYHVYEHAAAATPNRLLVAMARGEPMPPPNIGAHPAVLAAGMLDHDQPLRREMHAALVAIRHVMFRHRLQREVVA